MDIRKKTALDIIKKLNDHNYKAYLVGGCVRDMLMGKTPKDYDIVTDAFPQDILKIFDRTIEVGIQFGIVRVLENNIEFEIATFRKDGEYLDGRRPVSVEFTDEKEDVFRRDFTINGLLYDPVKNEIIDYIGGKEDINNKLIRTIGDPYKRFSEDYLRLIRAIRFATRFDFKINQKSWNAILKLAPNIVKVSNERIYDELKKILTHPNRTKAIRYLYESAILRYIIPEIYEHYNNNESKTFKNLLQIMNFIDNEVLSNVAFESMFALLFIMINFTKYYPDTSPEKEKLKAIDKKCRDMKFSNKENKIVVETFRTSFKIWTAINMQEWEIKRLFRSPVIIQSIEIDLKINKVLQLKNDSPRHCIQKYNEYKNNIFIKPLINGEDLKTMGLKSGKIFKEILFDVENKQLENKLSTKEEAINYIKNNYSI